MSAARKILVAEDEPMLRCLIVESLELAGFAVVEAGDGLEALDRLGENPDVRLLLSDVKMPNMDGYALAEAAASLRPELKILLMTGYGHEPPVGFLQERKIELLNKPFDLDFLAEKADAILDRRNAPGT
jgi:CheY-like chemotaxis protein